jgi:hypothetical protein
MSFLVACLLGEGPGQPQAHPLGVGAAADHPGVVEVEQVGQGGVDVTVVQVGAVGGERAAAGDGEAREAGRRVAVQVACLGEDGPVQRGAAAVTGVADQPAGAVVGSQEAGRKAEVPGGCRGRRADAGAQLGERVGGVGGEDGLGGA